MTVTIPTPGELRARVAEAWLSQHPRDLEHNPNQAHAVEGTRFRHSAAGKCSRVIQYWELGIEKSEPLTLTSLWVFAMGQHVHDELQPAFERAFAPHAVSEFVGHSYFMDGSFHADTRIGLVDDAGEPTDQCVVVEIKSKNGFGYKKAVGATNGPAEGAPSDAKLQAAMNACSTPNCLGAFVFMGALEAISHNQAKRYGVDELGRIWHCWWLPIKECIALATPEYERLTKIGEWIDSNTDLEGSVPQPWIPRKIPDPEIPAAARITDPATGTWSVMRDGTVVDVGSTWRCSYCDYQTRCISDGA